MIADLGYKGAGCRVPCCRLTQSVNGRSIGPSKVGSRPDVQGSRSSRSRDLAQAGVATEVIPRISRASRSTSSFWARIERMAWLV